METAEMLVKFPGTGIPYKRTDPDLPELRRFPLTLPFGNWPIVYTVSFNGIQILRVLHGAQNWQRLFP